MWRAGRSWRQFPSPIHSRSGRALTNPACSSRASSGSRPSIRPRTRSLRPRSCPTTAPAAWHSALTRAFAGVVIDAPVRGARVQQPFIVAGRAVDIFGSAAGPGIDAVHVWAFPTTGASPIFLGAAAYGRPRSDLAALFGAPYLNSGYQLTVRGLTPGAYTLTAFGHNTRTGAFSVTRQVSITVTSSLRMAVDTPVPGASVPSSFVVAGWALDGAATTGSGIDAVHVWAYPSSGAAPIFVGAATLGHARPDVAAALGPQFGTTGYALDVQNLPAARTPQRTVLPECARCVSRCRESPITGRRSRKQL